MRLLCLLLLGLALGLGHDKAAAETLVVVVRHAEKAADDPKDPTLSLLGEQRAEALATALRGFGLDAAYASQFRRTQLTAAPAARRAGVEVRVVPATAATEADAAALSERILATHTGESVLVVAHSNTAPAIVAALSGQPAAAMGEDEFDRFSLISIGADGRRRVLETRY
jgi:broad specificity phosphatase PhoE